MRFAPDGHAVAYTLGYGGGSKSIQIVTVGQTFNVAAVFPDGRDPRWVTPRHLVARSPDGIPRTATVAGYVVDYLPANAGDLDAAGGRHAFAADRGAGVKAYASGAAVETFPSTFEPGISSGGTLALRDLGSGNVRLERLSGCRDAVAHDPMIGPATRPRWSSQSLVVDTLPYGGVRGRTSPNQPTVDLSVPGRATTFPVALWTGARLFVGVVLDEGELVVADWGSLQARESKGWVVGSSTGSAFDWDLAVAPWSSSVVLVAYLTPSGGLAVINLDTATAPLADLSAPTTPPVEPPIEPPIEPPEPETPEPGPEPEPPPTEVDAMNWPPLKAIPRDQVVMMQEAIDGYVRANPRLGLPAGLVDVNAPTLALQIDALIAYGVNECLGHFQEEGPLPGTAEEYAARRQRAQDYTVHVLEAERGEGPPPPTTVAPGQLRGPIGTDRRFWTSPS